jgi:hypothetical protein
MFPPRWGNESSFAVANFELNQGDVSLSWYLTRKQVDWIVGAEGKSANGDRVAKLANEIYSFCDRGRVKQGVQSEAQKP